MSISIQDKLQDKLAFINPRAKSLIEELYGNLKILPEENQQRETCTKLLDEIIDSLIDNLLSVENSIYETQIEILLKQTKSRLEKIREKFVTSSTLNIQSFNILFDELTECIEDSYKIMSTIFKYVSVIFILFCSIYYFFLYVLFRAKIMI
jgi:hypothetical protein